MSYYLFLDDARQPSNVTWVTLPQNVNWVIAKSFKEFENIIMTRGVPGFVTYDCDLCEKHYEAYFSLREDYVKKYKQFETPCGITCAEFLISICEQLKVQHPQFVVHSMNQFGAKYIAERINVYNGTRSTGLAAPDYVKHNDKVICGFFGEYRFLSNFWPANVAYRGVEFSSVEIAYQAAKCKKDEDFAACAKLTSGGAKKFGRNVELVDNWENIKIPIMTKLLEKKFEIPELATALKATKPKALVEGNNWGDKFWGVAFKLQDGKFVSLGGYNYLGTLLMDIRDKL